MAPGAKRKFLSLKEKVEIIRFFEKNSHRKKKEIAKELSLPESTLKTVLRNRESILRAEQCCGRESAKRSRIQNSKYQEMENIVISWFKQARAENVPLDGVSLKEKALACATRLGIEDFKASNGWIEKMKKRHGLVCRSITGESGSVSSYVVEDWKSYLKSIIEEYDPKDIFNADETGLFFNLLPNKTLSMKGEPCHGGKYSKQRLTVLLCVNCSGTEKLKPFVVGKAAKPRCFKNIKYFPCQYKSNKKAWMTTDLFTEFLNEMDARMVCFNRKILLVVDQCPAHPPDIVLRNIRLLFLPANCTSELQPLDLGIIRSFKAHYKRMLVRKALVCIERKRDYKCSVLDALHFIAVSWNKVGSDTITNNKFF